MSTSTHNADAQWFIECAASELGERGTASQLIEMLKRGRPTGPSGVPESWLYSERQLGVGEHRHRGTIARARKCAAIWSALRWRSREVLLGRYQPRQWPPGVSGALGEMAGVVVLLVGSANARRRIDAATKALEAEGDQGTWTPKMAGLDHMRQDCIIGEDWDPVVRACQWSGRDAMKRRKEWLQSAIAELDEAQRDWRDRDADLADRWANA